jgi:hypothetical protein
VSEPDWHLLAQLDDAALQAEILRLSDAAMGGKTGASEDAAAEELPDSLQVMWLFNWLDYEVSQGSLLAYFYNSHGRFSAEAADALDRIGASEMARVLRRAQHLIGASEADWTARHAEMDAQGEYAIVRPYQGLSGAEQLRALTEEYWTAAEADDWGTKLDRYLRQSVDDAARQEERP